MYLLQMQDSLLAFFHLIPCFYTFCRSRVKAKGGRNKCKPCTTTKFGTDLWVWFFLVMWKSHELQQVLNSTVNMKDVNHGSDMLFQQLCRRFTCTLNCRNSSDTTNDIPLWYPSQVSLLHGNEKGQIPLHMASFYKVSMNVSVQEQLSSLL